jgi:hypothetical protein
VLRHKELHISHKQYKKRGIKMINEKRVKELFAKRNSSRVKIINCEYIYSKYLDEMIPHYVQYSGEVYVWNEEDLVYYNISRSECISLDFVLENVGM